MATTLITKIRKSKFFFLCICCIFFLCHCVDSRREHEKEMNNDSPPIDVFFAIEKKEKRFIYDSVKVGKEVWMQKNLDVITFRNGDSIFNAKTDKEWLWAAQNKMPAWCYYNNDEILGKKYGVLYNVYAVLDERGLAPKGWRLSTVKDWEYLKVKDWEYRTKYPRVNLVTKCKFGTLNGFGVENMENGKLKFLAGGKRIYDKQVLFDCLRRFGEYWIYVDPKGQPEPYNVLLPTSLRTYLAKETNFHFGLSVRCVRGNIPNTTK